MSKKREVIIPLIAAFFHGIIILFMSSWIFKAPVFKLSGIENKWQAVFCYFAALCVLYVFYWLLFEIMFVKNKDLLEWSKYSGIYFCILLIFFSLIYPMQSVGGDVDYFISLAVNYDMNWDLYYVSSLFYIVPMMIFPSYIAPSIFQMLILAFAVGYCVYRGRRHVKKWYLVYLPFLLLPVIYYAHFINRPPVYTSLYLVLITVLIFDYYEKIELSKKKLLFVCSMGGGLLAHWRYEGIYLLLVIPIWLVLVYKRKKLIQYFLCMCCISFLINIPQNIGTVWKDKDYNAERMKPFLFYTIPNMIYSGLQIDYRDKDFQNIDKVMDLERAKEIVSERGEDILEGLCISWAGGIKEDYTKEEYQRFVNASINIMRKNGGIFVKSKLLAWRYTASNEIPYKANCINVRKYIEEGYYLSGTQRKLIAYYTKNDEEKEIRDRNLYNQLLADVPAENRNILNLAWKLFKHIQWNLYIPAMLGILELIYAGIKKKWFEFSILAGVVVHTGIVFIMAPASYFHYYFVMYSMAYYMLMIFIMERKRQL